MKYYGTIKGKEKELGYLRRLVTQNKDIFFADTSTFFSYKFFMRDLMLDQNLAQSESERKINIYSNKIFLDEDDLSEKIYLIVPDEPDLLINNLFPRDILKYIFVDSLNTNSLYYQFNNEFYGFYNFFTEMLTELFKIELQDPNKKLKLIRTYLYKHDKNDIILNSKGNFDIIKQIFQSDLKDEFGNKLIDALLISFYIFAVGHDKYFENEKIYPLSSNKNLIELKDINFSLTRGNGFKELNFVLDIQQIGIIKFDLNAILKYSLIENRNFKI